MNTDVYMESEHGQLNSVDRLSDLPDFILHDIISFLPRIEESVRTCILSKRWTYISATNPVLEFCYGDTRYLFKGGFLKGVETTMQRYSKEKLRIRELTLDFLLSPELEFTSKLDEFLEIAVRNQVEKLVLMGPSDYLLPVSLFSAKSLKYLRCLDFKIPYCNTINLTSLETLILCRMDVEDRMLSHIISSCHSLKQLELSYCTDIKSIVIPRCSQLEKLCLKEICGIVVFETSSLKYFGFSSTRGLHKTWPVTSQTGLLRNLATLVLESDTINDDIFGKLISELKSLEILKLSYCDMLTTIRISSDQLKEIHLNDCDDLLSVWIVAPGLRKFIYRGEYHPAISFDIKSQVSCDVSMSLPPRKLDTKGFLKLKKLLIGLSRCNVLEIFFSSDSRSKLEFDELSWYKCDDIEFDEKLGNTHLGPPCDVKELKLNFLFWKLSNSSVSAFLDGLLWTCHPETINLRVDLGAWNKTIKDLIGILEHMARYMKYPLKRVEVIGADCCDLLELETLHIQLRLYW